MRKNILGHLEELRWYAAVPLLGFIAIFLFSYGIFSEVAINTLLGPARAVGGYTELFFDSVEGPFLVKIGISVRISAVLALPLALASAYRFMRNGLLRRERRRMAFYLVLCCLMAYAGIVASILYFVPYSLSFFAKYFDSVGGVVVRLNVEKYLSFAYGVTLASLVVLQVPVAIFALVDFGILSHDWFYRRGKVVLVFCFIFGAIVTPPDVLSQAVVALATYCLVAASCLLPKLLGGRVGRVGRDSNK